MNFNSIEFYSFFPYLSTSIYFIKNINISIDDIIQSSSFESVRTLGLKKIFDVINNNYDKCFTYDETDSYINLLSYIYMKILLICYNNKILIKRFAYLESFHSLKTLQNEKSFSIENLVELSKLVGLDISINYNNTNLKIFFSNFIRYSIKFKDPSWKIINKNLNNGFIDITKNECFRLIQESIFLLIEKSFNININKNIVELCFDKIKQIDSYYKKNFKTNINVIDNKSNIIKKECFPLCMKNAIQDIQNGNNLSHSMRFALVSYLNFIGMDIKSILSLFTTSPDFNNTHSLYQINHIISNNYKCPTCSTMKTYGNCFESCLYLKYNKTPALVYFQNINLLNNK